MKQVKTLTAVKGGKKTATKKAEKLTPHVPTEVAPEAMITQPKDIELSEKETKLILGIVESHKATYSDANLELATKLANIMDSRSKLDAMETAVRTELDRIANLEGEQIKACTRSILALNHDIDGDDIIYAAPHQGAKKIRVMLKSMMAA